MHRKEINALRRNVWPGLGLLRKNKKKGVEKALESPRTPPQLKKGLKKRQQQLESGSGGGRGKAKSTF
jgi:hypothetical protein